VALEALRGDKTVQEIADRQSIRTSNPIESAFATIGIEPNAQRDA